MRLDPRRPVRTLRSSGTRAGAAVRRRPRQVAAGALILLVATLGATWLLVGRPGSAQPTPGTNGDPAFTFSGAWSLVELQQHIEAGDVEAITAAPATTTTSGQSGQQLLARTASGQVVPVDLSVTPGEAVDALTALGYGRLLTNEALAASPPASSGGPNAWAVVLPLLMIGITVLLVMRLSRRANATPRDTTSFRTIMPATPAADGTTTATETTDAATPSVRLADVAGCDEAKLELTETIEFLRTPERFHKLGARIPRGIMLYGPPGTGKTMLARAVAAEAGVPFHHASGSEFVEKYVGVGAKRIRELFAQARKLDRGVIFFDEFDAIGKSRGGPNSHEEREQTLNQLLVELDGFGTTDDVVVIAATNRLDTLDSAVLRPGRFNRKIHVGLPDVEGRKEILTVHARNKPMATTVDLDETARKTYGFSGAELADLLNEAAILAARRERETIGPEEVHGGWLKVAIGTSRRRSMDDRERSIIAAHEVGHAICGKVHGDKRRVEEISLFAHGEALGVTVSSQEDNDLPSETDLRARLVALMGGRAAEEILFHEVTGGASNDFEAANRIATAMVTKWGMGRDPEAADPGISGRGSLSFLVPTAERALPSDVQAAATRAIRSILDEAYAEACRTLVLHMDTLRRLAAYLVEHERVDGTTFDELFDGRRPVPNALHEWRAATARPRDWGEVVDLAARRSATVAAGPTVDPDVAAAAIASLAGAQVDAEGSAPRQAPIPTAASAIQSVTSTSIEAVESEASPIAPAVELAAVETASPARVSKTRVRVRRKAARRARGVAAGILHRAERWLRSGELEADGL